MVYNMMLAQNESETKISPVVEKKKTLGFFFLIDSRRQHNMI